MVYDTEQDPLCYPGSTVLINKADLRVQHELDDFEFAMFLSRAAEPLPDGALDYAHYRSIHHHLFQDVYAWAGQPRTIRIAKGGNWFCFPENLEAHMAKTFRWLAEHDHLVSPDREDFAAHGAYFLAELNAGHPFRDGNGRTQLTFLKVLTTNAEHSFNDSPIEPQRTLNAMVRSFAGDLAPLQRLIADIIA